MTTYKSISSALRDKYTVNVYRNFLFYISAILGISWIRNTNFIVRKKTILLVNFAARHAESGIDLFPET